MMKHKIFLPLLSVVFIACSTKNVLMTTNEAASYFDQLGQKYHVSVRLDREKLEQKPLTAAQKSSLDSLVYSVSRMATQKPSPVVATNIGTFYANKELSKEAYEYTLHKTDSLKHERPTSGTGGLVEIDFFDHYKLNCHSTFMQLDKQERLLIAWDVFVVDTLTNDTIHADIVDSRFSVLSNPPFMAITSVDFRFHDQLYSVYSVYDHRAKDKLNDSQTLKCYKIE